MRICFFNYFHNGDLLATKEFIREFMDNVPAEYFYAHNKHPKNLIDLPLTQVRIPEGLPNNKFFVGGDDTIFINTWIAAYWNNENCLYDIKLDVDDILSDGITWKAYHKIFQYIIKVVEAHLGVKYELRTSIESYAHKIDYSMLDCTNIDKFLSSVNKEDLVLVSNGYVESNQSLINNDMSSWINTIAQEFTNKKIICTRKFNTSFRNILFTDDIIGDKSGHDMNEISYLSTFIDKILGRNSGPFLFTNTYDNLQTKNKVFLSLGNVETNCFPAFLKFDCDFRFVKDESETIVLDSIRELLSEV